MLEKKYTLHLLEKRKKCTNFYFISKGKNGSIPKIISYQEIENGLYNLGFGDYNLKTRTIDDTIISDNGDMKLILATIVDSIKMFFEIQPDTIIFITGSDRTRTKLYQRIIINHKSDYETIYTIEGVLVLEPLEVELVENNKEYLGFLLNKIY